jgi:hypothetical protein
MNFSVATDRGTHCGKAGPAEEAAAIEAGFAAEGLRIGALRVPRIEFFDGAFLLHGCP